MTKVEIFTGRHCGYCAAAKQLLLKIGLTFRERDIADPEVLKEMRERLPRARTIPQIFIDGQHIGGYDDLREHLNRP